MHIIMRSIFNLDSLRKIDKGRVAVLIDEGVGVDAAEYIRLLRPWRSWLKIDGVIMLAKPLQSGALKSPCRTPVKRLWSSLSERSWLARCDRNVNSWA